MARRRFSPPPAIEPKVFSSLEEIESGIRQLRHRLNDLDEISLEIVDYDNQLVHNLESDIRASILDIFGANSPEYREHLSHEIWSGPRIAESVFEDLTDYNQQCFAEGIPRSKSMLDGLIRRLEEKREKLPLPRNVHTPIPTDAATWDIFICHAGEDKDEIARPLAEALNREGLRVWYDELALTLGDSLRRTIDNGLAQSRYGAVILSPHFFEKEWPQRELDGLTAREVLGEKIVLPIWHNVTSQYIAQFSPPLADKVGVSTTKGIPEMVKEILRVVAGQFSPPLNTQRPIQRSSQRKSQELDSRTDVPDVRVSVAAVQVGSPGHWKNIIQVSIENHDNCVVYLKGGVTFELRDSDQRLGVLTSCIDGQAFSQSELHPGQAATFPVDPAKMKPGEHMGVKRAVVTDQIGRKYVSTEEAMKKALEDWSAGNGS